MRSAKCVEKWEAGSEKREARSGKWDTTNLASRISHLASEELTLLRTLYRFPEIVLRSASEYEPHYIANYLIEVARAFNSFYGNNLIVDTKDKNSGYKVALTYAFSFVMKTGLHLLGIKAPVKM